MKKFKISFRGEKSYYAKDIVTAIKTAQKDILTVHPNFNMEVFVFKDDKS